MNEIHFQKLNQLYVLRINSIWPWYSILFLYIIYLDLIISVKDLCIFICRRNLPVIFLSYNDFSDFRIKVMPALFLTYLEELIGKAFRFWWFFTYFLENMHYMFLSMDLTSDSPVGWFIVSFTSLSYWSCFLASLLTLNWIVEYM